MIGLRSVLSRAARVGLQRGSVRAFSLPAHEVVNMPALSPTMESGTIGKWLFKVGESVGPGDAVAEIETDKASMAFEAQDDFVVAKLLVPEGAEVAVGMPILVTVENAADVGAFEGFEAPAAVVAAAPAAPVAAAPAAPVAAQAPLAAQAPVAAAPAAVRASGARVFASPLARKLAREAGMDISALVGTGPNGRIVAADVRAGPVGSTAGAARVHSEKAAVSHGAGAGGVYSDFELSDMARGVAARYTHAKTVVPHYYLSIDLNLAKLLAMRDDLGGQLDVTAFVLKAAAGAMKDVPDVNGAWMDSFVRRYEQVDINLVMGSGDGLVTPLVRDCGAKGLAAIGGELADLEDALFADDEGAVVSGSAELAPGTFSVHDLGMFGVKAAAPIVLPPQSCALALGAITDTVVPHPDTKWAVQPCMTVTLSVDHRVVDGAVAAQWLQSFKTLIENPVGLML